MRVVGLVSFWDESPSWLAASISSLGRFCDHVVVIDGRYALYPDQRLQSSTAEHYAVLDAARAVGMGITLHTAPHTFPDEMMKRTHAFKLAQIECTSTDDWIFVLDADEVIVEAPTKSFVQDLLGRSVMMGQYVATACLWEKADHAENFERETMSAAIQIPHEYETTSPRFWRNLPNLRVSGYHFNYLADDADTGETVELWGDDGVVKQRALWAHYDQHFIIENRNRLRTLTRDHKREQYYKHRDLTGAETLAPLTELQTESTPA